MSNPIAVEPREVLATHQARSFEPRSKLDDLPYLHIKANDPLYQVEGLLDNLFIVLVKLTDFIGNANREPLLIGQHLNHDFLRKSADRQCLRHDGLVLTERLGKLLLTCEEPILQQVRPLHCIVERCLIIAARVELVTKFVALDTNRNIDDHRASLACLRFRIARTRRPPS
ncbi:hypothetical protein AWV80_10590 [Cupriavidus sp. UYMU48A]|nr:hypothetical protein AWV80_10590 [Cupriavidus sp. UYMU48A]